MNNSITVTCLLDTVKDVLDRKEYENPAAMLEFCNKLEQSLASLLEDDIDFKTVINSLDDSILITDSNSKVIYVNPNYKNNTGIAPEQILGKKSVISLPKVLFLPVVPYLMCSARKKKLFVCHP